MAEPMLSVYNINVWYGAIHAIKDISFNVNEGEIVALILSLIHISTIELVVVMVPPWPASVMILAAAWWPLKTATTLRSMTFANSSAV